MKTKLHKPNPFSIYRALSRGFEQVMPSGVTVTMRIINIGDYMRRGEIPSNLQEIGVRLAKTQDDPSVSVSNAEVQAVKDWIVSAALIEPRVTIDPAAADDQTLYVEELPLTDREAIFQAASQNIREAVQTLSPLSTTPEPFVS